MRILAFVVFLISTEFVMSSNSWAFQENSTLEHKTCKKKDRSFKMFDVPNILICGSSCVSNTDCKSFFFSPSSSRCDGCLLTYGVDSTLSNAREKTLYYNPKDVAHVGDSTNGTANRMFRYSGCFSTICGDKNCSYDDRKSLVNNTSGYCMETCSRQFNSLTNFALQGEACYCNLVYGESLESGCATKCVGVEEESCGGKDVATVYADYN